MNKDMIQRRVTTIPENSKQLIDLRITREQCFSCHLNEEQLHCEKECERLVCINMRITNTSVLPFEKQNDSVTLLVQKYAKLAKITCHFSKDATNTPNVHCT